MSQQAQAVVQTQQATPAASSIKGGILQRKCACGQHTVSGGECEECRKKSGGTLQRAAVSPASVNSVPPIVHDVLSSPGRPLDAGTRAFMEPRFGHDFSQVRVHTDARAAESARAVNALAYTVGRNVVFGEGQYAPETSEGRRLMAHELTHVVQQGKMSGGGLQGKLVIGQVGDGYEQEADQIAGTAVSDKKFVQVMRGGIQGQIQRSSAEEDPIHRPLIESFRREQGFPPGGINQSGELVGPSDAEIKYARSASLQCPSRTVVERTIDFTQQALARGDRTGHGIAAVMRVEPSTQNWDGTHIIEVVTENTGSRTCPSGIVQCRSGSHPFTVGDPGNTSFGTLAGSHNHFFDFHRTENRSQSILHDPARNPSGMNACQVVCDQQYKCNGNVIGSHTITRRLRKGTFQRHDVTVVDVTKT